MVGCVFVKYLCGEGYDVLIDIYGRFGCYLCLLDVFIFWVFCLVIETGMNRLGANDLFVVSLRVCLLDVDLFIVFWIIEMCFFWD